MSENQKLIVGLGNPGLEYEYTRHNIGWLTLDCLETSIPMIWKEKFKGLYAQATVGGEKAYFLKPHTFMNLSGESVQALCQFFKVRRENILIIHDEVDLPYGTMMLKNGGGLAGHNGLKSIAQLMGGQDFLRLRMGIGRPQRGSVSSYVLSSFSSDDEIILADYLAGAADAIKLYLEKGFEKAASTYSKKNFRD